MPETILSISPWKTHNENTSSVFQQSMVSLSREGRLLLQAEAFARPEAKYYSIYWAVTISPHQFINLAEQAVSYYETNYSKGVYGLDDELSDPLGADSDLDYAQITGVSYDKKEKSSGETTSHQMPQVRPLNWELIQLHAGENEISLARVETPIGDFFVDLTAGSTSLGFLSHLKQVDGFVNLIHESTRGVISVEELALFFSALLLLFEEVTT